MTNPDVTAEAVGRREQIDSILYDLGEALFAADMGQAKHRMLRRQQAKANARNRILSLLSMQEGGWRGIESAPTERAQLLLIGQYPHGRGWSDIYHSWTLDDYANGWPRWPHKFSPTHWMPLPPPPQSAGQDWG